MRRGLVGVFLLVFATFNVAFAEAEKTEDILAKVLVDYKKGAYGEVVKYIKEKNQGPLPKELMATLNYFEGLSFNKLQQFDKSVEAFDRAVAEGVSAPDVYYEQGQALYASQDLQKARKAFALSVKNEYLVPSSYYYIGHITQVLEQYHLALKYYKRISGATPDVAQAAGFQIAEVILAQAEKRPAPGEIVKDYVIPQYEKAYNVDESSSLAGEIQRKIAELKEKYDLNEFKLVSGRTVSPKSYNVILKESLSYDSNVTTEAESASPKAAHIDSIINKTDLNSKKRFLFKRRVQLTPQLRLTHTRHNSHRANGDIVKNDAYTLQPQFESSVEHKAFGNMASFVFEGDYNHAQKNVFKNGKYHFYSRTYSLGVGEKLRPFGGILGESTLKYKYKLYYGREKSGTTYTHTLSYSQPFNFASKQMLLGFASADFTQAPNNKLNSQNVYTFRGDYIVPEFFFSTILTGALSYTLTDTRRQNRSRGTEQTINPSLSLAKSFAKYWEFTFRYDYTNNVSRNKAANAYHKHVWSTDLQLSF
ncbi:MAG: tetratricopeptide repeat protein [Oligoflexia bacterium]|nr:tetratricopeptide repeat protein [Oligoflexia bacterium]MBF0364868.1 tetratricopeptide repeat protein [Oligoflexia bacterium]